MRAATFGHSFGKWILRLDHAVHDNWLTASQLVLRRIVRGQRQIIRAYSWLFACDIIDIAVPGPHICATVLYDTQTLVQHIHI